MKNNTKLELIPDWAKLPESVTLGYTHGVATDSKDRVFVFNMSEHAIAIFDQDGEFLTSWGQAFAEGAHGMHLQQEDDGQEYVYLTDIARNLVAKYTLDGEEILTIGVPPVSGLYPTSEHYKPTDIDVAPNGDIYVVDGYGQYAIHRYDSKGNWLQCWGGKADTKHIFYEPHGIYIDTRPTEPLLYVADRRHQRFVSYRLDGTFVQDYHGDFLLPCDLVAFGDDGFIIPDLNGRITVTDGSFQNAVHTGENPLIWEDSRWPNIPPSEWTKDRFNSPHALCVTRDNHVLVVEWVLNGRITKWKIT
ncbi:hypothetical protein KCTCHS21_23060 [Cohnella abietis]|uniref:Peptidylglycine monooxygenase n=2 Tax=Cohnella abietis TaxID=2507935 RepID=A0A3T1D485_9BACL|nr:hypothetical protein KCTCHS21_23060 [Cohnella abietis]